MARVLTGIQSSGRQHLGNILGAIRPAIQMSNDPKNEAFLFIADLHSLTSVKDAGLRKENLLATHWMRYVTLWQLTHQTDKSYILYSEFYIVCILMTQISLIT